MGDWASGVGSVTIWTEPHNRHRTNPMLKSDGRILTTHAGSLPRPMDLTRLYAEQCRRARRSMQRRLAEMGEACNPRQCPPADRGRAGHRQQWRAAAGGLLPLPATPDERLRPRRLPRSVFKDIRNHPDFAPIREAIFDGKPVVSNMTPPKVVGALRIPGPGRRRRRMPPVPRARWRGRARPAPSSLRHRRASSRPPSRTSITTAFDAYLRAITDAVAVEYRSDHRARLRPPDRCA